MKPYSILLATLASAEAYMRAEKRVDPPNVVAAPGVFQNLYHYGVYAAAAIGTIPQLTTCAVPPYNSTVYGYISNSTTNAHATLFQDDHAQEFILAFRGSSSLEDFITDFNYFMTPYQSPTTSPCTGCEAHEGFYGSYLSIAPAVKTMLSQALAKKSAYQTVITGHSLGGALSYLAYADLKQKSQYKIEIGYSYGQPRVGNQALADFFDAISGATEQNVGNFYRVTHSNDGVPQLPSQSMGFHHSRTEFWETDAGTANVPMANSTYRCFGQEPATCNDGAGGVGINAAHTSYAGIDYSTECSASQDE